MMIDKIKALQQVACRWQTPLGALALALLPLNTQAIGTCSATATGAGFGGYTFSNVSPTDVAGNVQVSCSLAGLLGLLVSYNISLSTGGNTSYTPRKMASGANWLQYNLYADANHTAIWGDGTSGTSIVSDGYFLALGSVVLNYPVYGRIPSGQNVPAGFYSDTIFVTVTY